MFIRPGQERPREFQFTDQRRKCLFKATNQEVTVPDVNQLVPKLVTSREQNLQSYQDVFEGIGWFPGPPYHIQIDESVTLKQIPIPVHLKEAFQQEIDKMLKAGDLKLVHEATPWTQQFCAETGLEI